MRFQIHFILYLLFISSCSNEETLNTNDNLLDNSQPSISKGDSSANCDFISNIDNLNLLDFHYEKLLNKDTLTQISSEQYDLFFDDSSHPNSRNSYFIGKFEVGNRTGLVSYSENKNSGGEVYSYYQIHLLEACKSIYTEYLALNDGEVMIYYIESKLSSDFSSIEITRTNSSYHVVGEDNITEDTLFTNIYSIDLSSPELIEKLKSSEFEIYHY
jgi:hypothetical protein